MACPALRGKQLLIFVKRRGANRHVVMKLPASYRARRDGAKAVKLEACARVTTIVSCAHRQMAHQKAIRLATWAKNRLPSFGGIG